MDLFVAEPAQKVVRDDEVVKALHNRLQIKETHVARVELGAVLSERDEVGDEAVDKRALGRGQRMVRSARPFCPFHNHLRSNSEVLPL